jgi:hypothetical protein
MVTHHQPPTIQLTASDRRPRPSHLAGEPSGLRPKPPLALGARPRRPPPTRSPLRSSASNRVSRHSPVQVRLFPPRPGPPAELDSQGPLARQVPLWLPLAWLSSLLRSLAPRRSQSRQMAPVPICKCLFSYTSPFYGFVSQPRFGFVRIGHDFPPSRKPSAQSDSGKWILIG